MQVGGVQRLVPLARIRTLKKASLNDPGQIGGPAKRQWLNACAFALLVPIVFLRAIIIIWTLGHIDELGQC